MPMSRARAILTYPAASSAPPSRAAPPKRFHHTVLPCPARKLECVLYTAASMGSPSRFSQIEVNFNSGSAGSCGLGAHE
ncbi:hypothetical protein FIBSPDRAFT_147516 [Athelia psychrophila]|uniref:Uncharacterized protein n=1 Tax=Athelia psychrophila TaxID=1759441 RepID=A0A166BVU5_9AGAM|nr:hypothetical protein FIBSPDRAFT_147516 [Fibularhizoctonia sp. CBS 109695]